MKRFAVKALKGKEFLQSKNDVIYLGDKSLIEHKKIVDRINEKNLLNNLTNDNYYIIVNYDDMAFNGFDYYTYEIIYRHKQTVLHRSAF